MAKKDKVADVDKKLKKKDKDKKKEKKDKKEKSEKKGKKRKQDTFFEEPAAAKASDESKKKKKKERHDPDRKEKRAQKREEEKQEDDQSDTIRPRTRSLSFAEEKKVAEQSPQEFRAEHEIRIIGKTKDGVSDYESPAHFASFSEAPFCKPIQAALAGAGFLKPSPIQAAAWPICLTGRDIISIAKTGSGKTCGFLLPAFHQTLQMKINGYNSQGKPTMLVGIYFFVYIFEYIYIYIWKIILRRWGIENATSSITKQHPNLDLNFISIKKHEHNES